ncbi:MAG: TlpA disulfide reductase family protein [Actinomycetota bacterium]
MTETSEMADGPEWSELDPSDMGPGRARRLVMAGLGAFIVVAAVAFVFVGAGSDASGGEGHLDISFDVLDGEPVALSDFEGQPLVVNFFASWCGPCRAEMPDFEEVHQQLGDDVRFIGLAVNDLSIQDTIEIVEDTGITYQWGTDVDAAIFEAYEGFSLPTTVFVEADGTITEVHTGILTASDLTERTEALIG